MACYRAWVREVPTIEEIPDQTVSFGKRAGRDTKTYKQPGLFTTYRVHYFIDYRSFCCGVDSHTEDYATLEEAERAVSQCIEGKHRWLIYDAEFIKECDEE